MPRHGSVHRARWSELPALVAYEILALRSAVFVVEQSCPYLDPDGRDLEPGAEQRWFDESAAAATVGGVPLGLEGVGTGVVACLRVLDEPDGAGRIGRVVTRPAWRSKGLAGRLVRSVVDDLGGTTDLTLDAQSHLAGWYAGFGFAPAGPEYLDVGIPHTPMRRPRDGGRE
jgi:ElaA protein